MNVNAETVNWETGSQQYQHRNNITLHHMNAWQLAMANTQHIKLILFCFILLRINLQIVFIFWVAKLRPNEWAEQDTATEIESERRQKTKKIIWKRTLPSSIYTKVGNLIWLRNERNRESESHPITRLRPCIFYIRPKTQRTWSLSFFFAFAVAYLQWN